MDYSKGLVDILTEITVLLIKETGLLDTILFMKGEMKEEPAMPSWMWIPGSVKGQSNNEKTSDLSLENGTGNTG